MTDTVRTRATYDSSIKIDIKEKHLEKGSLIIFGLLLCFTGIGMLLGIPMIIWGIAMHSYQKGSWTGVCPKCSKEIYWYNADADTAQGELSCPNCHVSITFYGGEFIHKSPFKTM